jgi:hypothetical protein
MAAVQFSIATIDPTVLRRLMGTAAEPGVTREIHNAGVLLFQREKRNGSAIKHFQFMVEFGSDNEAGAVANWLWSSLHGHGTTLRIGQMDVPMQHGAIKRALMAAAGREGAE